MAQAQSGICAEANLHGLHLFFNVLDAQDESLRAKLKHVSVIEAEFNDQFSESMLSCMVAIGAQYWPHILPEFIPSQLQSFPNINHSEHVMSAQPCDLFVQIRSDREDVNHLLALQILKLFTPDVELVEQIRNFRFLDGRDFNGFIYGGDTPHGRQKRATALVNKPGTFEDLGSYIHVQRFKHDLTIWQHLSLDEQEQIMGRTRLDNSPLSEKLETSHATRCEIKDQQGNPILLNQSMPYGDVYEQGLLSISCSSSGNAFEQVLRSRLGTAECYDHWLDFTQADMGSAFFAPSVTFLKQL
ncbi:Dyp-type peroxidase [Pseudoalteromonas sp. MMG010]|uniref:Dyp-type peroxidase n=1 Tax=Pseudoalteromonas sp. MMG010 TaxID=2822685 RepID=UPI001B3A6415|nr:Dyp-type peroxidase [Pseudoalteromonas sp. MMG010]MBQ4832908.1 Dyp-type peroxidase [Pseudoalteromonas sp. MMG010]